MRNLGIFTVVAAVLACVLAGSAPVPTRAPIPTSSGSIEVAGRFIPLPAGDWLLAGASHDSAGPTETRPYGAIETVVLFKLAGDVVADFITIRGNALPVTGSWGPAVECDRQDINFTSVFFRAAHENFCGFVNRVVGAEDASSSPAWREALALAGERRWRMPATWLMAGYRIANRQDVLDLRYHLNPEFAGFPRDSGDWAASEWSPAHVAGDQRRMAAIQQLARWVMETSGSIQQIAAGHGGEGVVLALPSIAGDVSAGTVEATAAPESTLKKTLWKSVTYRVAASTTTFLIALPFAATIFDASIYTLVGGVTFSVLYFLHELAWDTFGVAQPPPPLEFAGAGISA